MPCPSSASTIAAADGHLLAAADDAPLAATPPVLPLLVALQADDASEGVLVELVRAVVARFGALLVEALYAHNAAPTPRFGEPRRGGEALLLADDSRRRAAAAPAACARPRRCRSIACARSRRCCTTSPIGSRRHAPIRATALAQRLLRVTREQIGAVLEAYGDALGTSFLEARLRPRLGTAACYFAEISWPRQSTPPPPSPSPPPGGVAETCAECGAVPKAAVRWYACPRCGRRFATATGGQRALGSSAGRGYGGAAG